MKNPLEEIITEKSKTIELLHESNAKLRSKLARIHAEASSINTPFLEDDGHLDACRSIKAIKSLCV